MENGKMKMKLTATGRQVGKTASRDAVRKAAKARLEMLICEAGFDWMLQEDSEEELLLCDGFEDAAIGIVEQFGKQPKVLYDREKILGELEKDMAREEAEEYFDYNIIGAYVGEGTPAFATLFQKYEERKT